MRYHRTLAAGSLAALLAGAPAFAADALAQTAPETSQGSDAPVESAPVQKIPTPQAGDQGAGDQSSGARSGASQIIGSPLYSVSGEEVGEIVGLTGQGEGQSPQAILSFGGFMGFGESHVLVPVDTISVIDGQPVTTLTESDLRVLPKYTMPENPSPNGSDAEGNPSNE